MPKFKNQLIGITSGRNFRELGGYESLSGKKVKYHKLLRTGHLADLSQNDQNYLVAYGVKYDLDFRSQQEVKNQPDRVPAGVDYIFDPVFSSDLTNSSRSLDDLEVIAKTEPEFGFNHMLYAYEDMIESVSARQAYRKFFDIALENKGEEQALLYHCTAGKDRTGFASLLILTALGVPLRTIRRDYLLTNITTKDFVDGLITQEEAKGKRPEVIRSIRDIQSVKPEYFDHTLKVLNDRYGSVNNYLRDVMKLSAGDIMDLRRIYLD